ncbi:phage tail protein, partial [Bacillus thuringiensis]|nr:phage tail protein [Bacillus thuringiensis]MED2229602.1 phage tail protein [Bacillus thuringiensis]
MTIENKEIQYSVGIEDLYLCLMKGNETSSALPTYEDIVYRQTNISDLTIS